MYCFFPLIFFCRSLLPPFREISLLMQRVPRKGVVFRLLLAPPAKRPYNATGKSLLQHAHFVVCLNKNALHHRSHDCLLEDKTQKKTMIFFYSFSILLRRFQTDLFIYFIIVYDNPFVVSSSERALRRFEWCRVQRVSFRFSPRRKRLAVVIGDLVVITVEKEVKKKIGRNEPLLDCRSGQSACLDF